MNFFQASLRTTWLYSTAGGAYICVNAWVHPNTLPLQLTHPTPWLREDTFGIICFMISITTFFILQLTRRNKLVTD